MAARYLEIDEAHNLVTVYVQNAEGRVDANVIYLSFGLRKRDGDDEGCWLMVILQDARSERDRSWGMMVLNAFLPAGYPKSVTPDYAWYQIYVSAQGNDWRFIVSRFVRQ